MMGSPDKKTGDWKERVRHELIEYAINVVYLAFVFAAFTVYRRLVLAAHDITYTNYGVALIEALILGKVIMIGGVFRLGRGLEAKPLIFPTLYKAVVFSFFVYVFNFIEHLLKGLWQGRGLTGGLADFFARSPHELVAGCLIVFVAFIPFFAMKELGRVLGEKRIWTLFFRKREPGTNLG